MDKRKFFTLLGLLILPLSIYLNGHFRSDSLPLSNAVRSVNEKSQEELLPIVYASTEIESGGFKFGFLNLSVKKDIDAELLRIISAANFPKGLLAKATIVFMDNLPKDQFIIKTVYGATPISLTTSLSDSEGLYLRTENGNPIILIDLSTDNKKSGWLEGILFHELGHLLGDSLIDADKKGYYSLRDISESMSWDNKADWHKSPDEDFAENFKYLSGVKIGTLAPENLRIKTTYGLLIPVGLEILCQSIYDRLSKEGVSDIDNNPELQQCRRERPFMMDSLSSIPFYKDAREVDIKAFFSKLLRRFS